MIKKRVHPIDCNHSWLQVPDSDLAKLSLREGDFAYAGFAEGDLYLSDDEEMGVYLEAATAADWEIILVARHYPDWCKFIRNLPYRDAMAEHASLFRIFNTLEA